MVCLKNLSWSTIYVNVLAIDPLKPTALYAGGDGVFKSTDAGDNWTHIVNGLTSKMSTFYKLSIDPLTPSTLYAGTNSGAFKSTDAGELLIDPLTPSNLYMGRSEYGFYKSTDGGDNWIPMNSMKGLGDQIVFIAIDPLTPSTLYAYANNTTTGGRIWKSTDGGDSWTAFSISPSINFLNTITDMVIDPLTPSTLYVYVTWQYYPTYQHTKSKEGGLFKSTDGGSSWTVMNNGLYVIDVRTLAIDPLKPTTLYAGGDGVFKSTDAGENWTAMNNGLDNLAVNSLVIDPVTPSTLYAGTSNGVYIFVGDTINGGGGDGNHSGNSDSGCFIGTVLL